MPDWQRCWKNIMKNAYNYFRLKPQLLAIPGTMICFGSILQIVITHKLNDFYTRYLDEINKYKRDELNEKDKLSYDVFSYEMKMNKEGLGFHDNYIPFNQFYALPLTMGQLGSGSRQSTF